MHLSRNSVFYDRTKDIKVKFQIIKIILEKEIKKIFKISTKYNPVDENQNTTFV